MLQVGQNAMKKGTIIATVILAGYVGLETYTIRQASDRMEPAYIHNLLIEAMAASQICQSSALELEERFTRTLQRTTSSYQVELSKAVPQSTEAAIEQQLTQRVASSKSKVAEEVNTKGCSHPDIKAHFQRYRIYAKKSR